MRRILLLSVVGWSAWAQGTFREWTIPTPNSQPHCVVSDSRGRIWYASFGANQVGVFDPATGQFRELRPPTPDSRPHGIAVGPDDTIWFTEQNANKLARVDPATFEITEFPLPKAGSGPHTPIYDGRGGIWFTEQNGGRIGRLNIRNATIEEFEIPTPNSGPYGIIADADGNAWFCSFGPGSNRIGRVDAQTGRITEYRTPTPNSGPRRPWIDSRGRIWITENRANKLAVFDPATEQFREWDSPNRNGEPYGIVVDGNDRVWYNEFSANTLVQFDPKAEKFTVFPFPTPGALVRIVAVDPFNRIWYGDNGNSKLGVLPPGTVVLNAASFRATTGLAPGTIVAIFGTNLAGGSIEASTAPLPTTLGDTTVTFNGVAAPLFFVSGAQVNAQVPPDLPFGNAQMQVKRGAAVSLSQPVNIEESSPGIFTFNQQGTGAGAILGAPAQPGEFVAIFCTGLGRTPQSAQVRIANLEAVVSYSGPAPGFVGLYQVNAQVPAGAPAGAQPVRIILNGVASNIVTLAIR